MDNLRATDPGMVGRYRLVGRLGSGGMGVVYLAEGTRGRVALKVVRPELGDDVSFRARFRREVQSSFRVSSAVTAKLMDFDTECEQPWMATEYVEGRSLDELVEANGPLDPADQRALALGLAEALVAIHAEDVVHRDLKPANVMITATGPKVIDFGIAAAADSVRITSHGLMVGSPGWLAPEQIEASEATPSSDIFTFGLVMCFASSGDPPFGTGPTDVLLFRALNSPPNVPLDRLARELHRPVLAAVSRDPAQRPTALQLLSHLQEVLSAVAGADAPTVGGTVVQAPPTLTVPRDGTQSPLKPYPGPWPARTEVAPPPWPTAQPSTPGPNRLPTPRYQPAPSERRRRFIIPAVAAGTLAVAGAAVGLTFAFGGSSHSSSGPTPPSSVAPSSVAPSTTGTPARSGGSLSSSQMASLANAALVKNGEFPTRLQSVTPTAITLPCNLSDVPAPSGALLKGERTQGAPSDGNYLLETVAVLPTEGESHQLFSTISNKMQRCAAYDANSGAPDNHIGHVTIAYGPTSIYEGDESSYVEQQYTPKNHTDQTTGDGTAVMRVGNVVLSLLISDGNEAHISTVDDELKLIAHRIQQAS